MANVNELMLKLAKIARERELVKKAQISEAAKGKLFAELQAQTATISAELEKADVAARKGA